MSFVCKISHSKKNSARYYHKCTQVFTYRTHYYCQIVMKVGLSWQIFEKSSNAKFHVNQFSGIRVVPCGGKDGQTNIHEEANSPFSQICEGA